VTILFSFHEKIKKLLHAIEMVHQDHELIRHHLPNMVWKLTQSDPVNMDISNLASQIYVDTYKHIHIDINQIMKERK